MSVYVDRLPECCDCCVCNDDYWRCGINCKDISHEGRREDCPLKEIVRCKDCKWFDPKRANFVDGYGYCERYEVTDKDSHYCSYGEKKVASKSYINQHIVEWLFNELEQIAEKVQLSPETSTNKVDTPTNTPTDIISRQAAIEAIINTGSRVAYHDTSEKVLFGSAFRQNEIIDIINALPPVDPKQSEIIRCKNCRHDNNCDIRYAAQAGNGFFCGLAERKNECPPVELKPVCDDAISRADTLKALCAECDVKCEDGIDKEAHCTEYAAIKSMPPVEPKRPKGKWIVYPLIDDGRVELECPECGETFIQAIDYRPHFCENCGADMRGE